MKTIRIIDYGTGNIGSLLAVVESLGLFAVVTRSEREVVRSDLVILPGVGAAGIALHNLKKYGLYDALKARHQAKRPILGICLGAQLFGGLLHEAGEVGFGWLAGEVPPLKEYPFYNNGWCRLDYDALLAAKLSRGLRPMNTFFFNHRYVMGPDARKAVVSVYQSPEIPAIYLDETICAVQFHPEKSQINGRLILRNIIEDHYGL